METGPLVQPEQGTSVPRAERRDRTVRALRGAVAAWFFIHPALLAPLDGETVERMALRLEGRRPRRRFDADDVDRVPAPGHPWAG
jgi:hypothetical protein